MDIFLFVVAGLLIVGGVLGSVLPALPGPPLGYIGLLLLQCTEKVDFSTTFLLVWLAVVVAVTVADNFIPAWATNRFGGSRWAAWGSMIGLVIGMFFAGVGIIVGTLLGAIVGELLSGKPLASSLRAGFGAFIGFLLSTGLKLMVCGFFVYYYFRELLA